MNAIRPLPPSVAPQVTARQRAILGELPHRIGAPGITILFRPGIATTLSRIQAAEALLAGTGHHVTPIEKDPAR
jgi:hypothetical protein